MVSRRAAQRLAPPSHRRARTTAITIATPATSPHSPRHPTPPHRTAPRQPTTTLQHLSLQGLAREQPSRHHFEARRHCDVAQGVAARSAQRYGLLVGGVEASVTGTAGTHACTNFMHGPSVSTDQSLAPRCTPANTACAEVSCAADRSLAHYQASRPGSGSTNRTTCGCSAPDPRCARPSRRCGVRATCW